MKIIVQNGVNRGISREEAETIVGLLPQALSRGIKSLTLYQADESGVRVCFYPKERIIGLFWPGSSSSALPVMKLDAIEELLIALFIVAERGELPKTISKSLRTNHLELQRELIERCKGVVFGNAV